MVYKLLCVYLLIGCVIACSTDSTNDSIFPVPPTVDEENNNQNNNNTSLETLTEPIVEPAIECLPDFHGEFVSGKLDKSKSDFRLKRINAKSFGYYYTLALGIDDTILIQIVLSEIAPGITPDLGQIIKDEDLLLVKLERLREPGIWEGVLVKNLTTNFSFGKE